MRVFTTRTYERAVRKLLSETDRQAMEAAIVANPGAAPVLRGTGGLRKLRWGGSGRGKVLSRLVAAIKEEDRNR